MKNPNTICSEVCLAFFFFFFGKCWHGFLFDQQASNWINTKVAGAGQSLYREYTTGQGQEKRGQETKILPALLKRLESPKKTSYKIQIRIYTSPGEKGAQKEAFSLTNEKGASSNTSLFISFQISTSNTQGLLSIILPSFSQGEDGSCH